MRGDAEIGVAEQSRRRPSRKVEELQFKASETNQASDSKQVLM